MKEDVLPLSFHSDQSLSASFFFFFLPPLQAMELLVRELFFPLPPVFPSGKTGQQPLISVPFSFFPRYGANRKHLLMPVLIPPLAPDGQARGF